MTDNEVEPCDRRIAQLEEELALQILDTESETRWAGEYFTNWQKALAEIKELQHRLRDIEARLDEKTKKVDAALQCVDQYNSLIGAMEDEFTELGWAIEDYSNPEKGITRLEAVLSVWPKIKERLNKLLREGHTDETINP